MNQPQGPDRMPHVDFIPSGRLERVMRPGFPAGSHAGCLESPPGATSATAAFACSRLPRIWRVMTAMTVMREQAWQPVVTGSDCHTLTHLADPMSPKVVEGKGFEPSASGVRFKPDCHACLRLPCIAQWMRWICQAWLSCVGRRVSSDWHTLTQCLQGPLALGDRAWACP